MAHVAKFNAKQIAIFGEKETVANSKATITADSAVIMTGLTYDPNITSNSEQLAGGNLDRDTIFSITDSFAEFSGDTYLPVLGNLVSSSSSTDLAIAPFLESCNLAVSKVSGSGLPANITTNLQTASINLANTITAHTTGISELKQVDSLLDKLLNSDASNTSASDSKAAIAPYLVAADSTNSTLYDLTTDISTAEATFYGSVNTNTAGACTTFNTSIADLSAKYSNTATARVNISGSTTVSTNNPAAITIGGRTFTMAAGVHNGDKLEKMIAVEFGGTVSGFVAVTNTITVGDTKIADVTGTKVVGLTASHVNSQLEFSGVTNLQHVTFASTNSNYTGFISMYPLSFSGYAVSLGTAATTIAATVGDANTVADIISTFNTAKTSLLTCPTFFTASDNAVDAVDAITLAPADLIATLRNYSFTNGVATAATLTCEIRKNSYDITDQKIITITGAKGTADINIKIGERPKLKLNMHGNFLASGVAVNSTALASNLTTLKTNIAPVTSYDNIVLANLSPAGSGTGTSNLAFQSLSATNVDGFSLERTLTGDGNFWYPNPIAHDVTISILEEKAYDVSLPDITSFHPEDNIGKEYDFTFTQGSATGNTYTVAFTKLTLKSYKHSTQGNVSTQDLTFECAGTTTITLS